MGNFNLFTRIDKTFEPSSRTKKMVLYIKKRGQLICGFDHPGLWADKSGFTLDAIAFFLAVLLELVGVLVLYDILNQGETNPIGAILAVAGAFFADFTVAYYHHKFATGSNDFIRLDSILASSGRREDLADESKNNIRIENNKDLLARNQRISFLLSCALIVMATIKFAAFYFLSEQMEGEYGLLVFMAIAYLLTAIIHIKSTGYFIFGAIASWFHHHDVKHFQRTGGKVGQAKELKTRLRRSFPDFGLMPGSGTGERIPNPRTQYHEIVCEIDHGTGEKVHMLKTYGILLDDEINEFLNQITNENAKKEFTLTAMEAQLRMIDLA